MDDSFNSQIMGKIEVSPEGDALDVLLAKIGLDPGSTGTYRYRADTRRGRDSLTVRPGR
jgi:hypothetical protein